MAIFGWGKSESGGDAAKKGDAAPAASEKAFEFSPEKARKFFERAQQMHEATNYEYAMNLWLKGLRQDPTGMAGVEGFFKAAGLFMNEHPKGPNKDFYKEFSGRSDVDKWLYAMLEWSAHPTEATYAIKALQSASKLGLRDATGWIGERALGAVSRDKKPKKEQYVTIMETLAQVERFDLAVQAGEAGVRLDPTDGRLSAEVKNMSAESTMKKSGFDQTGQEGGFRSNIRDAAKQKALEEGERSNATEETVDRLVAAARAEYELKTTDRANTLKYIELLQRRGRPEDEEAAIEIADGMYATSQEYRFREIVDTIRARQLRRKASRLKAVAEQPDASDEAKQAAKAAAIDFVKAEIASYEGQIAAYPTDLGRKFELAKRYYQVKRFEDAIGLLQESKDDGKNRGHAHYYLGLAFQQIGWNDEAIDTLRIALTMVGAGDEKSSLELRYGLMEALLARASDQKALIDADEAYKIASSITIQNINYKQIRARREDLKALIAKLKGGPASGGGVAGGGSGGGIDASGGAGV